MLGLIRRAISATVAPRSRLRLNSRFFREVVHELHRRGDGRRESGGLLLGSIAQDGTRVADDVIFYEDLDPASTRDGAIELRGELFAHAWEICARRHRQVVADVHSHPGRAEQSEIDRANPAVALPGHVAIIIPNYARDGPRRRGLGVFEYCGGRRWRSLNDTEKRSFLEIGWWV